MHRGDEREPSIVGRGEKTHFARQRRYREKHGRGKQAESNVTQQSLPARSPSVSMVTRNADGDSGTSRGCAWR